ncbi:hypothetical protein IMSAGC002_02803 [Lachnospiraceae bacterium]|nr:hypothetical protein IMSAGC002_02803 [Lachnospiraceae bacterium]
MSALMKENWMLPQLTNQCKSAFWFAGLSQCMPLEAMPEVSSARREERLERQKVRQEKLK